MARCLSVGRKSTSEATLALQSFAGGHAAIKCFHSDNARELAKAAKVLNWPHSTSVPYVSQTNGIAERCIRTVEEGTRALLEQSGLPTAMWPWAAKAFCFGSNVALQHGDSSYNRRFKRGHFKGLMVPFGVPDPVLALQCPLGVSAILHKLSNLCVEYFGYGCLQRSSRLLHLSKLFMLFNFNDFGAWMAHSRWRTDHTLLSNQALSLTVHARADAASAIVSVAEPLDFRDKRLRIAMVTYCNYNDQDGIGSVPNSSVPVTYSSIQPKRVK